MPAVHRVFCPFIRAENTVTIDFGASLSNQFWVQFSLALFVLTATVVFIDQYKRGIFRTFRAKLLRRKLAALLTSLLPVIVNELSREQADLFAIFRLRADVELLMKKGYLLFSEERFLVSDFLARLSSLLAKYDARLVTANDVDEITLAGQRAILELTEIGF